MDLVQIVRNRGIVGAGGAGFPFHVKISGKAEYIILNAAECEPLLRVDQQLILNYADEILEGLEYIVQTTGAKRTFIAIKGKHKKAVKLLKEKIKGRKAVELCILDDFYPAGDEQVLVNEVTKRVVPEAAIPFKVGCIVTNVETVLNMISAIDEKPVTDTYLTINGKVPNPITLKLPVGLAIREALLVAGLKDMEGLKVIEGGPMMGKLVGDVNSPITKTTKGLIVLDEDHYLIRKKSMTIDMALRQSKAACLQCRMCTELCPRYLLGHNIRPHLMMRKSNYDRGENIKGVEMAALCSECAACELYVCPAGLSPRLINLNYKNKLSEEGIKYVSRKDKITVLDSRDYRKIPTKRLIIRLGLKEYDLEAPLIDMNFKTNKVKIPLKQHIGSQSISVVKVGEIVKKGDLIGEIPENALGARIHASIDGKVTEVNNYITIESI